MKAYDPPKKTSYFLLVLLLIATILAWASLTYLRPAIVDKGCMEIAIKTNNLSRFDIEDNSSKYRLDNIKARCLDESLSLYE